MYTVYSLPNAVVPLLGGYLVDKIGVRIVIVSTTVLICIGQIITWLGTKTLVYNYLLFGRGIFGLGGETQISAGYAIVNKWFADTVSMAFGIQ